MNFLQRIWQKLGDKRDLGINTPGLMEYFLWGGGNRTASGVNVNENNALLITTVYQCVRVIADTVASLPFFVYKRLDSGKERAVDHPLYRVLHEAPNPHMAPFEFKQSLQGHLCLWGKAFAEIERNGGGRIVNLWPLRPDRMKPPQLYNGKLYFYYVLPDGGQVQFNQDQILYLRGLTVDGLESYSPTYLNRDALGLAKASEEYRGRFFSNDAHPGGVLEHPGTLSDGAFSRLKKSWQEAHGGLSKSHRVAILEEGTKWHDVGIPPDAAQFIEGQEYQKGDIAAIFRVPPYKIGLLKPGTVSYSSVEQQAIDFVVDCIRPWLVCWEERVTLSLLTEPERRQYFAEFLVDALLRGDSQQRAAFYTAMFNIGAFSQNDILEKENMNGIGTMGDRHYVPLNMIPVDLVDQLHEPKVLPTPDDGENKPVNGNGKPSFTNGVAK